ncbi:MAG: TlpA family protein disulfide reductase [Candidatus Nanohaloarchaea archaeon]
MPFLDTEAPSLEGVEWITRRPETGSGTFLLNFWQSSCMECRERLERMEDIHRSHPGLQIVDLHVPELLDRDAVEQLVEDLGFTHHVGHDGQGKAAERYGPGEGLFLLHDGELAWQKTPGNSMEQLRDVVEQLTGEPVEVKKEGDSSDDKYLGYDEGGLVNETGNFRGEKEFELPESRIFERLHLDGRWSREEQFLEAIDGRLFIHQVSSAVGLVAAPGSGMKDVEVTMDGEPVPGHFAGDDLRLEDGRSYVRVNSKGIYSVVKGQRRRFELGLEPEEGARLYKLSFR